MAQPTLEAEPRVALGVAHVRQSLDELLSDLAEPIAITVQGRRVAVLVPYARYVALVRAMEEKAEAPEEEGSSRPE